MMKFFVRQKQCVMETQLKEAIAVISETGCERKSVSAVQFCLRYVTNLSVVTTSSEDKVR